MRGNTIKLKFLMLSHILSLDRIESTFRCHKMLYVLASIISYTICYKFRCEMVILFEGRRQSSAVNFLKCIKRRKTVDLSVIDDDKRLRDFFLLN